MTAQELEPDSPLKENLCKEKECQKCVEICPVDALNRDADFNPLIGMEMDKRRCFHYNYHELGGLRCGLCISVCHIGQGTL